MIYHIEDIYIKSSDGSTPALLFSDIWFVQLNWMMMIFYVHLKKTLGFRSNFDWFDSNIPSNLKGKFTLAVKSK